MIFFNTYMKVFHIKECYNKTHVLKINISDTSSQMHVNQPKNVLNKFLI
jgi:hypothetical protein